MLKRVFVVGSAMLLLRTACGENWIRLSSSSSAPGASNHVVKVSIDNDAPVLAFSFAASFTQGLTLKGPEIELGSALGPGGAAVEWHNVTFDSSYFSLAVVVDFPSSVPPYGYDDRTLAVGAGHEVLRVPFEVSSGLGCGDECKLTLRSDIGSPPIESVFTVLPEGSEVITATVFPRLEHGTITIVVQPTLSGISPTKGDTGGGTKVTVTGSGFGALTQVLFSGSPLVGRNVVDSTTITGTTPPHSAGTVDVIVNNGCGLATLPGAFTYASVPVAVHNVDPPWGPVGVTTFVMITGEHFTEDTQVTIADVPLQNKAFVSATTITGDVPPRQYHGKVDVKVSKPGASDTLIGGFGYAAPPGIFMVTPNQGEGGVDVTIFGEYFTDARDPNLQVMYGFSPLASVQVVDDTTILCRIPACGAATGWTSVTVVTSGGGAGLSQGYECGGSVPTFRRGDANCDGKRDIGDAVFVLSHLFGSEKPVIRCEDALDSNDDGKADISDPIYLLQHLFAQGPAPPPPYPGPGTDPTSVNDKLDCDEQCGPR